MDSDEKINFLKAKIPTILGVGVLLVSIIAGIFLVTNQQVLNSKAAAPLTPKDITVANVSSTDAAIFWQTDVLATGFVQAGPSQNLGLTFKDDRDSTIPKPHFLHFVTLTNLAPNTTYYYRITSGVSTFPRDQILSFKTGPELPTGSTQPIIGTVLDSSSRPVTESIVVLEIPGAQRLATLTKGTGGFILPLSTLRSSDLSQGFDPSAQNVLMTLNIFNNLNRSTINISPPFENLILPPITLGLNLDLTAQLPTAVPSPVQNDKLKKYDLNSDGVVNSLDQSIIIKNLGRKGPNLPADLNGDGMVDQKDLSLMINFISNPKLP